MAFEWVNGWFLGSSGQTINYGWIWRENYGMGKEDLLVEMEPDLAEPGRVAEASVVVEET